METIRAVAKEGAGRARTVSAYAALVGGVLGLVLAPLMVIVKYMTGWSVVPEPAWVVPAQRLLARILDWTSPQELWTAYGSLYTLSLILVLIGYLGLLPVVRERRGRREPVGYWIILLGLILVIPGDAIHSWTWHWNGLITPTPGTNPVANTAYAVHMMGMNLIMIGSVVLGVSALQRKLLPSWLAWLFVLILPAAVVASLTVLPTTPSGALWLFSVTMMVAGYGLVRGHGILVR